MQSHVLVIGPGAIGAWTAARLADAGHEVTVACRTAASATRLRTEGVTAVDEHGDAITAQVAAVHRPKDLSGRPDVVLLATKCAAAVPAWRTWRGAVPDDAPLVALQNGLMGDALADEAPGRLVLATVTYPATRTDPGVSERTGPGGYLLGSWPPRPRPDPHEDLVRAVLDDAAPSHIADDIRGVQWSKLLINSAITSLGALTGEDLGRLLRQRRARAIFLDIFTEGYAAGTALGVDFASIHGRHPRMLADRRLGLPRGIRHVLLRAAAARFSRHRSSSLQSLQRGEPTEVDFLNGVIVDAAGRAGLSAPVNAAIVAAVHDIETGKTEPSLERLGDVLRARHPTPGP